MMYENKYLYKVKISKGFTQFVINDLVKESTGEKFPET